jgi:hypothetical protein
MDHRGEPVRFLEIGVRVGWSPELRRAPLSPEAVGMGGAELLVDDGSRRTRDQRRSLDALPFVLAQQEASVSEETPTASERRRGGGPARAQASGWRWLARWLTPLEAQLKPTATK